MFSMADQDWYARLTESTAPRLTVSQILCLLKKKELELPVFVCLQCSKETHSQQAMAAHCRQHVRAGMGKGTVEHIKYYPDHTFMFLCNNPQAPSSTGQQVMAEPTPMPMNQVPTGGYNRILPYTGSFSISDLAKYPWLQSNGSHQNFTNNLDIHATHATLQQPRYNPVGSLSSVFPSGGLLMNPSGNCVGTSATPASVPPEIDLTLRLGRTPPRPTAEVSAPGTSFRFQISRYF